MNRTKEIAAFIEHEFRRPCIIEPEKRSERLREHILDLIATYRPGVIVKAGLGSGPLLAAIARACDSYLAVVDPSPEAVRAFAQRYAGDPILDKIRFVIGEFNRFPIDYYAADLLICVDYLEFLESGPAIDEFRRALQFEGILLLAGPVLGDDDTEGIYDDFMRAAFPLHNDYYLRDDLKTILDLNEFTFVKGTFERFRADLSSLTDHFEELYPGSSGSALTILDEHRDEFAALYGLSGTEIDEPYYLGVFMRRKPRPES